MNISELPLSQACWFVNRVDSVRVSYTWLGSPRIIFSTQGQEHCEFLSDLEDLASQRLRSIRENPTPEAFIQTGFFAAKVCQLQDLSQAELQHAHCISVIFYRIRQSFISIVEKFIINDDLHLSRVCYLSIPQQIAQQNHFATRFPPFRFDSELHDALYTPEQVLRIFPQLDSQANS
jgi:hypothetical protein